MEWRGIVEDKLVIGYYLALLVVVCYLSFACSIHSCWDVRYCVFVRFVLCISVLPEIKQFFVHLHSAFPLSLPPSFLSFPPFLLTVHMFGSTPFDVFVFILISTSTQFHLLIIILLSVLLCIT